MIYLYMIYMGMIILYIICPRLCVVTYRCGVLLRCATLKSLLSCTSTTTSNTRLPVECMYSVVSLLNGLTSVSGSAPDPSSSSPPLDMIYL